ncbi:RdgB/HAM1 family non-canonical purine NTP pyrophosphatase [Magnetofaba australis]|uniref:dITP/XTP pyrophosphatase n=1 Tax=Magnetofaba australis IT-1 TaxID=1434232 RepID=A0A1Y2K504_9PROT|nr:RdgB/HAM1 family non-canonical purine NTP pyrophosphatase [Magnetofaba australis]OSM02085.1 putative RdgB/HAM1 family non-canonical purine NTP pyrophosphatase [Magnetofaba australis IT-1]
MKVLLATRNRKKIEEMRRMLAPFGWEPEGLDAHPDAPEVVEDGDTFAANALKKAREIARHAGCLALSDDSGLEVDGLDGAPGVYSARYAGEEADDQANLNKLIDEAKDFDERQRRARFRCVLALCDAEGRSRLFDGTVEGRITDEPAGENGFGYDPAFIPDGYDRTFAQMSGAEKDGMSHRGRALRALVEAVKLAGVSHRWPSVICCLERVRGV